MQCALVESLSPHPSGWASLPVCVRATDSRCQLVALRYEALLTSDTGRKGGTR